MARRDEGSVAEPETTEGQTPAEAAQAAIAAAKSGEGEAPAAQLTNNVRKLSPKNKISRGVDPSLVTTWVPVDNTKEDNERLRKVAVVRKVKVADVLLSILKEALADEDVQASLTEDAAKAPETVARTPKAEEPLPEDPAEAEKVLRAQAAKAQARLDKANKAIENARKAIEAARAKAQERGINADVTAQPAEDADGTTA